MPHFVILCALFSYIYKAYISILYMQGEMSNSDLHKFYE